MGKRINSRKKGAAGELEWSHFLKEKGFTARRTQQFSGIGNRMFGGEAGDSDVICQELDAYHFEVKRVELININKAMKQAIRDSETKNRKPIVAHRKNHCEWLCTMKAEDLITILKEAYERGKGEVAPVQESSD